MTIHYYHTLGTKDGMLRSTVLPNITSFRKEDDYLPPQNKTNPMPAIAFQGERTRYLKFESIAKRDDCFNFLKHQAYKLNMTDIFIDPRIMVEQKLDDKVAEALLLGMGPTRNLFWQVAVILTKGTANDPSALDAFSCFQHPMTVINCPRTAISLLRPGVSSVEPKIYITNLWALTLPVMKQYTEMGINPFQFFNFLLNE